MALEGANKDLGQDVIPKGIVARSRELIAKALANRYVQLGMGAGFGLYRMSRASVPLTPINVASGVAVTSVAVEGTRVAVKGIQKVYGLFNRQSEVQVSDDEDKMEVSESDGDMIFFSTKELKRKHDSDQSSEKLNISASVSEGDEIVENESPDDENRDPALSSSLATKVDMIDGEEYEFTSSSDPEVRFNLDKVQVPAEQVQLPGEPSPKRPRVEVNGEASENSQMEVDFAVPAAPVEIQAEAPVEMQVAAPVEMQAAAPVEKQAAAPRRSKRKRGQ